MKILGIETSCDETAAAVVQDGGRILSNIVSSQVELHRAFSGVVPELASRAHLQKIPWVIEAALRQAGGVNLDAIAYTRGPGLAGPLLVGRIAAQTLAYVRRLPLIGIHHLEGHLYAVEFMDCLEFPCVALIVSGGHTDLVLATGYGRYQVLGRTRDDAAGEAFDKVAKMLGLGYPGGPAVDRLARQGKADIRFPRPFLEGSWDFSFSGLKTAVVYFLRDQPPNLSRRKRADVCASFQEAVVDTLIFKTFSAARQFRARCVAVGGGVAANSRLRERLQQQSLRCGIRVLIPAPELCTDNGAMIAQVAFHRLRSGKVPRKTAAQFRVDPGLPFENWG